MKAATISRFHSAMSSASRQRSASRRSMSSSSSSMRDGRLDMKISVKHPSDGPLRDDEPADQCQARVRHVSDTAPERCQTSASRSARAVSDTCTHVRDRDAVEHASSASVTTVSAIRIGPARVPSRDSPEEAVALLKERGYTACEIDCEGGSWMGYPFAERFGEL